MVDENGEDPVGDEISRLKQENDRLENSLRELQANAELRLIDAEMKAEAVKAGIIDLDGLKLAEKGSITIDDRGNVNGIGAVLGKLRRDKPWLFGTPTTSSTAPVPTNSPSRLKLATEMSLDEWRAARAELLRKR